MSNTKVGLAIFASGSGTNAENICKYFENSDQVAIVEIFSNRKDAFVMQRAKKLGVKSTNFSKEEFQHPTFIEKLRGIDYLILAGFLWLIPKYLVEAFPDRIINIHPALLPKYGGEGMYGDRVHQAVIKNEESESGITIHLVNEEYDKGTILFQAKCDVRADDTPESLGKKVHDLEYQHFPAVIENYITMKRGSDWVNG